MIPGFTWDFPARVLRPYDADTIWVVDVDQGLGVHHRAASVGDKFLRIRVDSLWCPEIRSRDPVEKAAGLAAKAYADTLLPPGTIVVVHSRKWEPSLERVVGSIGLGPFDEQGRPIRDYATLIIEAGHGTATR